MYFTKIFVNLICSFSLHASAEKERDPLP